MNTPGKTLCVAALAVILAAQVSSAQGKSPDIARAAEAPETLRPFSD